MTYYIFERNDGATLADGVAKKIVKDADYDETQFTYTEYELDKKKVKVTPTGVGSPDMAVNTLEHASRTKTGTPITVTKI
jgi:hypothetical protein